MVRLLGTNDAGLWLIELNAAIAGPGRTAISADELRPVADLMQRTHGVRFVAVVPLRSVGLAVAVALTAPDAGTASSYARALVAACVRQVGLGEVTFRRLRAAPEPAAS